MFTGACKKITGNGLAAGCQLFYRKIYGYFSQCVFIQLNVSFNQKINQVTIYVYCRLLHYTCISIQNIFFGENRFKEGGWRGGGESRGFYRSLYL